LKTSSPSKCHASKKLLDATNPSLPGIVATPQIGSANQNLQQLPTTSFSTEISDVLFKSLFKTVEVLFVSVRMSLGQDVQTNYDRLKRLVASDSIGTDLVLQSGKAAFQCLHFHLILDIKSAQPPWLLPEWTTFALTDNSSSYNKAAARSSNASWRHRRL
jgi:hypothetical protein